MAASKARKAQAKPSRGTRPCGGNPSLFAADSEEDYFSDSGSDGEGQAPPSLLPLDEEIREPPRSLASLLEVLTPRLQPRAGVKGLSVQDQQAFSSILVGELASQFSVIQHQVDNPFLTPKQNKQLHRLVVVQVCKIVEGLYQQYIAKAASLGEGDVFSVSANLTRLKAELTVQANRSLNIPAIRRRVSDQLGGPFSSKPSTIPPVSRRVPLDGTQHVTLDDLALDQPLRMKLSSFGVRLESGAVQRRVQRLKASIPEIVPDTHEAEGDYSQKEAQLHETSSDYTKEQSSLFRVCSVPELRANFLLCDLGLTSPQPHHHTQLCLHRQGLVKERTKQQRLLGIHRAPSVDSVLDLKGEDRGSEDQQQAKQMGELTVKDLADDLRELSHQQPLQPSSPPTSQEAMEDIHPLLQACVHGLSQKRARRLADYDSAMRRRAGGQPDMTQRPTGADSSLLELSIPSVPTLEQLPYLSIQRTSGSMFSLSHDLADAHSELQSGTPSSSMPAASQHSLALAQGTELTLAEDSRFTLSHMGGRSEMDLGQLSQVQLHSDDSEEEATCPLSGTRFDLLDSRHQLGHEGDQTSRPEVSGIEWADHKEGVACAEVGGDESDGFLDDSSTKADMLQSAFSFSCVDGGEGHRWEEGEEEEGGDEPLPPLQPAVVTTRVREQEVIRTADIRVSERTPVNSLRLKAFGPIYNELTGELTQTSIDDLDSNLNQGKEITAVYREIMKTLPSDHLEFEKEPTLEPCLDHPVELSRILASDTLHHRRSRRVINPTLHRPVSPPWGRGEDRRQWEQSNQYKGPDLKPLGISKAQLGSSQLPPELAHLTRAYTSWLRWWRSTIDADDYRKFASRGESDFLRLAYHLYDSDGSDSEAEQEVQERKRKLAAFHARLVAKREKMNRLRELKNGFQRGMWNANTVTMGGLGGDPEVSSSSSDDDEGTTQKGTAVSTEDVQARLQQIWSRLHFPSGKQVDMAIKYSNQPLQLGSKIYGALSRWERACDLVENRERFLSKLEAFERKASDPSRFFSKGCRSSSVTRLDEARTRDRLHKELDRLDKSVSEVITKLQSRHGDTVTYKGRAYREKMMSDRTEMLYWLQQERRQAVLTPAILTLNTAQVAVPPACAT